MRRSTSPPIEEAIRHTAVIGDPISLWSKLAWDIDVFRDIQVSYPDETEPLCYASINVCLSAWSLRNWLESVQARDARRRGETLDSEAFYAEIARTILEQAACEAIANTAKHARLRDGDWPGGEVRLEWREGDEDVPPGYVLLHWSAGAGHEGLAISRFDSLCDHWWAHLNSLGLADGHHRIPDWQQRMLHRIFGRSPYQSAVTRRVVGQQREPGSDDGNVDL